ncbi:MAG: pyruvoyl-dependent arginine decarboxylase [Pseudomonadota bacterium]
MLLTSDRGLTQESSGKTLVLGNRVPRDWFWFQGLGVSNQGYGDDPYHTIAFDIALRRGGVEDYNLMSYSSVLPAAAYGNILKAEVGQDGSIPRPANIDVTPGSVLEVIMAARSMTVPAGRTFAVATGLGLRWAANPKTPETLRNGYVVVYDKSYEMAESKAAAQAEARTGLEASLQHILDIRELVPYGPSSEPDIVILASHVDNADGSEPLYATQLTGIGCHGYLYPHLDSSN